MVIQFDFEKAIVFKELIVFDKRRNMKNYTLNFNGYWRESRKESVPAVPGVYLVYRCVYNSQSRTVTLRELIYIGKAINVNRRVAEHSSRLDFHSELQEGEEICYSVAEVSIFDYNLVENALIFAQKPRLNEKGKDSFNYPDSSFNIVGRCALLKLVSFSITNP